MAEVKWTKEQESAIYDKGSNILVAAAAGSGKTAVLVERILHKIVDEKIDIEWARIPHFYNSFYVYQYATGYCAAIALAEKILKEGESAVEKYKDFLRKGNSEYSIDLLKGAGVDMTEKTPIESALKVFENLIDKMEKLFS